LLCKIKASIYSFTFWVKLATTAKDGGSVGYAGAVHRPTAKDGGSVGYAGDPYGRGKVE